MNLESVVNPPERFPVTLGGRLKAWLVYLLFRVLRATWRLEEEALPPGIAERLSQGLPVVFAHFHEDEWAMIGFYAYRRMNVMVSLSRDGGVMAAFLHRLGFGMVRGSSSRGGATALLQLIRVLKERPGGVSLAVDGPKGPRRRVKKGIFKLAQSLDAPIVAGVAVASRAIVFRKSWSKAFVPKPFSRVRLLYTAAMTAAEVQKGVEREDYAVLSSELEERMKSVKKVASESLGIVVPPGAK